MRERLTIGSMEGLGRVERTVLAKLDADSRTEAVARAAHLGLVML
jgi:hypothetical protein